MNNDTHTYNEDLDFEMQDIEQMLTPRCEFHASDSLKEEVMDKARQASKSHRMVMLWPLAVAACVAGAIMLLLMPPRTTDDDNTAVKPFASKVEKKPVSQPVQEEQPVVAEETMAEKEETPQPHRATKTATPESTSGTDIPAEGAEQEESPVQMSEETRMELLMAYLSSTGQDVHREIDTEEEIRQLRLRGDRMLAQINIEGVFY